jgi:hypothetical protein
MPTDATSLLLRRHHVSCSVPDLTRQLPRLAVAAAFPRWASWPPWSLGEAGAPLLRSLLRARLAREEEQPCGPTNSRPALPRHPKTSAG